MMSANQTKGTIIILMSTMGYTELVQKFLSELNMNILLSPHFPAICDFQPT